MKKSFLLLGGVAISILLIAAVATSIDDFFMPGSQPGDSGNIEHPNKCDNCHGGYNQAVEPAFNWRGSMMAQAARDPLFYACLAIANQDAPGSGDLCIRCHAPDGWLNGRSTPTDGSALNANDREGVQCDFCHKLVKPFPMGNYNPYPNDADYNSGTFAADQDYLLSLTRIPLQSGNGMYIASSENAKRGPFVDAAAKHQMYYSPFHSESNICGTCHDVSSPALGANGEFTLGGIEKDDEAFRTKNMLPIERTFSEWSISDFATSGVSGTPFGGNKATVSTCQDCHMRDVSGYAANKSRIPHRDDLPLHDMTGGNTFIPDLVSQLYPDEVNVSALEAGKQRALFMLQNAASLDLSVANNEATVRVTNKTAHKLPSGYPEGRRIWINLKAYDSNGNVIYQSGKYDNSTAILTKTGAKIYEIKLGMDDNVLLASGVSNEEDGTSFHFVLNNKVVKDNRIPPLGATNTELVNIQSPVVTGGVVDFNLYPNGENYDETSYTIPAATAKVKATLYYQTVSLEYAQFLKNNNETNDAGNIFWAKYVENGMSAPVVMCEKEVITGTIVTETPIADFSANQLTGEAPFNVQFTDQSINSPTSWSWNFGDGTTSTEQNPEHTFSSPGTYTVSLAATNSSGSDTETKTNYITVTEPSNTSPVFVNDVIFTLHEINGGRSYVSARVILNEPVNGATVTALLVGSRNTTVSGITSNGIVTLESLTVKGTATWCIDITNIVATGYTFGDIQTFCQTKSAVISTNSSDNFNLKVFPNPFKDKVQFEFISPVTTNATLDIFNSIGVKVKTLFDGMVKNEVKYMIDFEPETESGGMYLYRLKVGDEIFSGRLVYEKK